MASEATKADIKDIKLKVKSAKMESLDQQPMEDYQAILVEKWLTEIDLTDGHDASTKKESNSISNNQPNLNGDNPASEISIVADPDIIASYTKQTVV